MMTLSDIFGVPEPRFGVVERIFGGAEPKFGGARLPNDLEMTNRDCGSYDQIVGVGRIARRAVGTNVRQLFYLGLFAQLRIFSLQTWHTFGQRLGALMGFDQMQRQHPSSTSGKPGSHSGTSPHQAPTNASPHRHLTNIKTFVPYFSYPIVSL
jgi:hypothetical protein